MAYQRHALCQRNVYSYCNYRVNVISKRDITSLNRIVSDCVLSNVSVLFCFSHSLFLFCSVSLCKRVSLVSNYIVIKYQWCRRVKIRIKK